MKDWSKITIFPSASIRETMQRITENALQIALVIDEDKRLLGTVTDGDIRYGILRGVGLDDPVHLVMQSRPIVANQQDDREALLSTMRLKKIRHMPLVDADGYLLGLETLDELLKPAPRDNPIILMAGGLGSRLRPLTDDTPKPLLPVGGRPILENILLNLIECGYRRFFFAVNYKAQMFVDHFGDGSRWGVSITYIHETEQMGTAGALGLLPERPEMPFLVMNADLLTKVNFNSLFDYHAEHQAKATMCVREYDFQVPYGVVTVDNHKLLGIEEKPVKRFFVNAGIYVIEPDLLDLIPPKSHFDMPQLFDTLVRKELPVTIFPIKEYWLDIGQMNDYLRAMDEYRGVADVQG